MDGLNLAYQVVGDGPIDIVMVDEWATPLEGRWEVPAIAGRLNRLAESARIISFDKRGIGLSDADERSSMATPELWVRDLVAVVQAAGATHPVIFGSHEGGPIALMYAASFAATTDALILTNTGPRLLSDGPNYPWGHLPGTWMPDEDGILALWESGAGGEAQICATAHDPWWRDWYAKSRRAQASPAMGQALMQMIGQVDVRHILSAVHVPTLVLHRTGNAWWPVESARWMAEQLPQATFRELDGADNYWWAGNADSVVDEVERFLLGERTSQPSARQLVTIMFTDIVDSTKQAADIGDAEWSTLLNAHDSVVTTEVERHGGSVVKNLGDGFLIRFDGPAAAITAGREIRAAVERVGLCPRVTVHTGEVEVRGDDITGVAVNLAARLLTVTEPGEILVSSVVRGLVAGSNIQFNDRGRHQFKGIPDRWHVYAVSE